MKAYEKYYNDVNYNKFSTIACQYCNGYMTYPPRKDILAKKSYYVFGIHTNHFVEPDDYPEGETERYVNELRELKMDNLAEIFLGRRDWMDMDYFIKLYNLLKDAGAKNVWLHPSEKWNSKTKQSEQVTYDREWLLVIEC